MGSPSACSKLWQRAVMVALLLVMATSAASPAASKHRLLVMGDSLSAGYGLAAEQGWVSLLAARLHQHTPPWTVVNASVSGETTAGGASRIAQTLATHAPQLLIIELGANDGLRGLPLEQSRMNLQRMIDAARASKTEVLLVGMRMPPNYGLDYTRQFESLFSSLAQANKTALLPFLLEPVANDPDAFQSDNLHPVAAAQPRLLEHVWTALQPLLEPSAAAGRVKD